MPDPRVGEELCVYLRLHEGAKLSEQDITDYCKDKVSAVMRWAFHIFMYKPFVYMFFQNVVHLCIPM